MIKKYWEIEHPKYDAHFDNVSDNAWEVWRLERVERVVGTLKDRIAWQKRFHCTPILKNNDQGSWSGLKFKNKADYVLFLLEWS